MSPMTPRPPTLQTTAVDAPRVPEIPARHRLTLITDAADSLDLRDVASWTPRQVARWMYDAGLEQSIVEKFQENDISGAILMTLKFEDLRELDIASFGQRTKIWNEIHVMRGSVPNTPQPATPIDESMSPCTEIKREPRQASRTRQNSVPRHSSTRRDKSHDCDSDEEPRRHRSTKKKHHRRNEPVTPLESVSIVGIEQLMPKPHKCSRGENCSKWRRQQRLIESFKNDHPISPEKGGSVWVAGNPGNPVTAEPLRPTSDAVPSVVASSDVLGPGTAPSFSNLEEASLRNVESRDPQDNVKQFLTFQHLDPHQMAWSSEVPPTPPYEMFPNIQPPHTGLRSLPKLSIPPPRPPPPRSASAGGFSPYNMERVEAQSPELRNQSQSPSVYRFGTPFSDMMSPSPPSTSALSPATPPNPSLPTCPTAALFLPSNAPNLALQPAAPPSLASLASTKTSPRHDPNHRNSSPSPHHSPPTPLSNPKSKPRDKTPPDRSKTHGRHPAPARTLGHQSTSNLPAPQTTSPTPDG